MDTHHRNTSLVEQVALLCRHMPFILGGSLLTAIAMVYVLHDWVPTAHLWSWSALVAVLGGIRYATLKMYIGTPTTPDSARRRARVLTVLSALSGCLWGTLGYIAVQPGQTVAGLVVAMVLTGMVASGIASLSPVLSTFYAFAVPTMLPPALRFIGQGDEVSVVVGALTALFLLAALYFSHGVHRTVVESIVLRFENLDLIERLQAEKQHAESARIQAERANLAKSKFLAAASHDLRQPMHALALFSAALTERSQRSSGEVDDQAIAANIDSSVRALEILFDALLDISKLDAGAVQVHRTHFRIQDVFDLLHNDYLQQAVERGLELHVEDCDAVVETDEVLLARVLRNLVSNATRYTTNGSVKVTATEQAGQVRIAVADTGDGISEADLETVFDEFVQLENPERDHGKGLGLGLSIVRRLADLLDHPLGVESRPGHGSTFSIAVPCGSVEKTQPRPAHAAPATGDWGHPLIVVIDDEASVRTGMRALLGGWHCQVLAVDSADAALLALEERQRPPDAVVADYRLRDDRTGIEAIESLRLRFGADLPGLIVTGDTAPDRLREAAASGLPLLHKPFQPEQLRDFLRRSLRRPSRKTCIMQP